MVKVTTTASPQALVVSAPKVTRIVFTALLLDILAFTIILPLFPRLLQFYRDSEHGSQHSLLAWSLSRLTEFQNLIGLDDSDKSNGMIKRPPKMDIVLLGGALGSLFSVLQFVASPVIGKLSDVLGRRRVLLVSMLGNLLSCGVWLFSSSFELFVLSRVIGGLSEGNVQLSIAMISDITTPATRSRGLAMVGIAFAISFTIGPALGAYFANKDLVSAFPGLAEYGLHPFSGSALLALVLLTVETLYLYTKLPETNSESWRQAIQHTINEEKKVANGVETTGSRSTSTTRTTTGTTTTTTTTTTTKIKSKSVSTTSTASMDPETIARRQHSYLAHLSFTHFAHLFLFSGMEFTLTFLTFHLFDFTHMQQGALLGYIGILSSLIQGGYVRRVAHKVGEKRMVIQGMVASAIGLGCIALVSSGKEGSLVLDPLNTKNTATSLFGVVEETIWETVAWLSAQEWSRQARMWGLYAGATGLAVTSATVVNCLTSLASLVCDMGSDLQEDQDEKHSQAHKSDTIQNNNKTTVEPIGKGLALGRFRSWGQLGRAAGPIAACSLYWRVGPLVCYGTASLAVAGVALLASRILPEVRKLPLRTFSTLTNAMKKRVAAPRQSKKKSPAKETTPPGTKRQLPLDFSRHALRDNVKKQSFSHSDATNSDNGACSLQQQEHWHGHHDISSTTVPISSASSSTPGSSLSACLDPPVIYVNLTGRSAKPATATTTKVIDGNASLRGAGELSTSESHLDHQIVDEDELGYSGQDDDLIMALRNMDDAEDQDEDEKDTHGEGKGDEEEHSSTDQKDRLVEETLTNGLQTVKHEPIKEEKDEAILPQQYRWKTVYVAAFELALDTVLPEESFLFTDEEHTLFETYRCLPDDPKHLFVRLFLRNQKFWIRQSKLENRYREIEDLETAIRHLVSVGLLMDQSALQDTEEAIATLGIDELKLLARHILIITAVMWKQRRDIVSTILRHFRQQSFLSRRLMLGPGGHADGGKDRKVGLATHSFSGNATKRDMALIDKILQIAGSCVKIYPNVIRVFERLHLVFYRTKEYTEKPALIEAILAKIGQRTFPTYEITRTNTVFKNRDELLQYEEAMKIHYELSNLIDSAMGPGRDAVVYVRDPDQPLDRATNQRKAALTKARSDASNNGLDREQVRRNEVVAIYERVIQEAERIRDAWRMHVTVETGKMSAQSPDYFLLRFSPGWVYTQILRLELRALAFLKRFEEESLLLHELLDQHVYSLGARGSWYDRLALIKSNYSVEKRLGKKEALEVCMTALRDKHVHAVDANLIQARIVRLESELKVAFRERHDFSYLTLRKAQKRILTGERLNTPGTIAPAYASSHAYSYVPRSGGIGSSNHPIAQQRPLWRNIDGSDCGVEELALSYYGMLGYRGYHSENSILATLFGLLFWDILFAPQPGVFETLYQTEPLDLRTDAFFLNRQQMILGRLEDIAKSCLNEYSPEDLVSEHKDGTFDEVDASDIRRVDEKRDKVSMPQSIITELGLEEAPLSGDVEQTQDVKTDGTSTTLATSDVKVEQAEDPLARKRRECFYLNQIQTMDELYREKKVVCVGVNWSFEREELLQIAECIGGPACWNYEKKLVKFVEVKGPGDRLSSKQQVWIDLLTSLNVDIELCIVQVSKAEDDFQEERDALN
ncbi:hypothetical protein BGZ94_000029 [Podila epigama]|nr:hypothetical protein BGZ94_000029 [Podila epigama]